LVRLSIINALSDILSELLQLLDNRNRFVLNGRLSLIKFVLCIGAESHHLRGLIVAREELHLEVLLDLLREMLDCKLDQLIWNPAFEIDWFHLSQHHTLGQPL
jgi:hypothetical protein